MIQLLKFYDFTEWKSWTTFVTEDANTSLLFSNQVKDLENAVKKFPNMAWQKIGSILGLNVDLIEVANQQMRSPQQEKGSIAKRSLLIDKPLPAIPPHDSKRVRRTSQRIAAKNPSDPNPRTYSRFHRKTLIQRRTRTRSPEL